tara:strand:- start:5808 stop:6140 length:333 start_codon:yes stop_codon:yes gene_type:complete
MPISINELFLATERSFGDLGNTEKLFSSKTKADLNTKYRSKAKAKTKEASPTTKEAASKSKSVKKRVTRFFTKKRFQKKTATEAEKPLRLSPDTGGKKKSKKNKNKKGKK